MREENVPAREGDYICIMQPHAAMELKWGKNWRRKRRLERRARRRWVRMDIRVSQRCYSDSAYFYRDRLSVTRAWLDRLRANTMRDKEDMKLWRALRKCYFGRVEEPTKRYK